MSVLRIVGTDDIPDVFMDAYNGIFRISGISRPENLYDLYSKVIDWLTANLPLVGDSITMEFNFKYSNTASRKMIYEILAKIDAHKKSKKNLHVLIKWYYNSKDDDLKEYGHELSELVDMQFEFIEKL